MAQDYDRLVGDALFPAIREGFESAVDRYGLGFASAADIGCGTGRFLRYLLGYRVPLVGVDCSVAMLRVAARRLAGTGVRLLRQDLRSLRLPRPVDLITCNGCTLNYLLDELDLGCALGCVRDNLRPGGFLIADVLTGVPRASEGLTRPTWVRSARRASRWRAQGDPRLGLTRVDVDLGRTTPGGWRWAREVHVQRWWPLARLRAVLSQAGLRLLALRRLQGSAHRPNAAWVQLLATRPDGQRRVAAEWTSARDQGARFREDGG